MELWQSSATTLARMVQNKKASAREVCASHLARIDKINGALNAIVRRMDDDAFAAADRIDCGEIAGPLAGVPATSKINTDHAGHPTDNGVVMAKDSMPPGTNATLRGLMAAGGVFVGRSNAPAMSMRGHTDNVLHGATLNPFDPRLSPGGSSGGAAVAVATGMCAISQGNDIAGSLRFPAFCNGVVALRPSLGRMATHFANLALQRQFGSQMMSTNGPLARTVGDIRTAFAAMSVPNWDDPLWSPAPLTFESLPRPIRVALIVSDGLPMHAATREAVKAAGRHLADAGYEVEEATPPALAQAFTLWPRIGGVQLRTSLSETLSTIADPGLTAATYSWLSFLPEVNLRGFVAALAERDTIGRAWNSFFDRYPILITPVFTRASMRANEDVESDKSAEYLAEAARYTMVTPPLGLPSLAVPVGQYEGLPQGVQIVARRWREDLCLDAGEAIQQREGIRAVVDPVSSRSSGM
jgi:amidase